MRTYGKQAVYSSAPLPIKPIESTIAPMTRLLPISEAVKFFRDRGISLSAYTIRQRCKSGAWTKGQYWVRPW